MWWLVEMWWLLEMWWLFGRRCGGSLVALLTAEAAVPGSNPASPAMILMRCRVIVK